MARAVWSGAISFGLVSVPVKAYKAVRPHTVHFHQIDTKGSRIRYEKVSEQTGKPVDDIKLGYERSKGHYVPFDPDEIEKLRPASTRTVDITDFVDLAEIDPLFYDASYWLAPDGEAGERAYGLLVAAMEDQQKVGIGTVVMRNKQHLTAIRPVDNALVMSTMRFADEVVPKSKIDGVPSRRLKADRREVGLAHQIIDALTSPWKPEKYHDTYTEELRDLIERRAEGEEIAVEEAPEEEKGKVLDLMAALEASLDASRGGRPRRRTKRKAKAKAKARARKSA